MAMNANSTRAAILNFPIRIRPRHDSSNAALSRSRRLAFQVLVPGSAHPLPDRSHYNRKNMIRFSTAGESHGEALIALVSGLPAGLPVDLEFINRELWRRQQGYGRGGRMKIETDKAHILSGVRHGK